MEAPKYIVDIRWSEEDGVYLARVPELDGVVTHGQTVVEAAKMAEEAIELHLESLRAHKEVIPDPVALQNASGKYPLRMDKETHQDILIMATKAGDSVNELINKLIKRGIRMAKGLEARSKMKPGPQSSRGRKATNKTMERATSRGFGRKSVG